MDYWTFHKIDERARSSRSEISTIEHIDGHLNHERNKNHYLERKNESLRIANQQFASSYEGLKIQVNELFQEKTALFQKNINLLFELNHLKREVISYKELLCKTSSKNKTLLLSIKTSYDDLVRNMKYLDEFIATLPQNNDNLLVGDYVDDNEPRFQFSSPRWNRIYPINIVLSPIPEENSILSPESNASGRKKHLTSESLKHLDKTKDENGDNAFTELGSHKKIISKVSQASFRETFSNKDLTAAHRGETIDLPDVQTKSHSPNENKSTSNLEFNDETIGKTYTIESRSSAVTNVCENYNFFGYSVGNVENQNIFEPAESPIRKNMPDVINSKSREPRCFYPPLQNKIENHTHQSETRIPATPISNRNSIKVTGTPMHRLKLPSLQNSLLFNTKDNDVGLINQEEINDSNISKLSLNRVKINNGLKGKRKLKNRSNENSFENGKKKRRNSIFEVVEYLDDEINRDKRDCLKLDLINDKEVIKLSDKQSKIDSVSIQPQTRSRSRQKKNIDKNSQKDNTKNVRSKKAELNILDMTIGVKTRSKRKCQSIQEQRDKENADQTKMKKNKKQLKNDEGTPRRLRSRWIQSVQKDKVKLKDKVGEKCGKEKIGSPVPISTPKSINVLSETTNFNELSISPIGKMIQDNEQKVTRNLNEKNKISYEYNAQKTENQDQNKYIVLADILKSTANNEQATKSDIASIKKFLTSLVCCDKKVTNKIEPVKEEPQVMKESPREDSGISNSVKDNINSLLSTLSPSLVSILKSFDIQDNSMSLEVND